MLTRGYGFLCDLNFEKIYVSFGERNNICDSSSWSSYLFIMLEFNKFQLYEIIESNRHMPLMRYEEAIYANT